MGNVIQAGLNPLPFIIGISVHGAFEIPAIILAGAGALKLGAVFLNPQANRTVSESWLRALADAIKVGVAVVFPLVIIAAILEVYLTPAVLQWAISTF
jgi:uncharacterized membrane protein SpoIIM required for sporulation